MLENYVPSGNRNTVTSPPSTLEAQNIWIKAKLRAWQVHWHKLFDEDPELLADGEFGEGGTFPDEIDCDFRLIYCFSKASIATRQKCFACFPNGHEMSRRFEDWMSTEPTKITPEVAEKALNRVTALIGDLGPNEEVDFDNNKTFDRDGERASTILKYADDITILLERSLLKPVKESELLPLAAHLFLSEPLYAAAGNFTHLSDWVTAANLSTREDELYSELYQLWRGGWQVMLDDDGVILVQRDIRTERI